MTLQQALMKDARPPHTPSPLSADADATVTGTDIICLAGLQEKLGSPLAIAAALTRERDPFTGEKLKPATVLYSPAEHAASQVIQPRFAGLLQRRKIRRLVVDFARSGGLAPSGQRGKMLK